MNDNQNTNDSKKLGKRIPNIPKKPQKGPKFNVFWIYAAIIIAVIAAQLLFSGDGGKKVDYPEFESKMLLTGDVERLVAFRSEDLVKVEVYIKPEALRTNQNIKSIKVQEHFLL